MIPALIRWSISNRFLVLMATVILAAWGVVSLLRTPVDALPDLSDVQVIIRTPFPGQAPRIVEDQVTYPLTTMMLSVPGAKTVRGFSLFGDSFVYVLFEDGTDLYWARSRVLEYLNQVQGRLPAGVQPALGPDATGVGWVYEYALVDPSGKHDISQLRAIQDWFLKYELKSVRNVAEVATVGGMVRGYQIVLLPDRLRAYGLTHRDVIEAVKVSNQETGGSVLELGEAEYVVRASGYLRTLDDFRGIPLRTGAAGVPVRLGDVARIQIGPEMRRGIAELDGMGEVTGGIVIMRSGKNALETITAVKSKLAELKRSLPPGVEVIPTYDRSGLIERSVRNLASKLVEEFVVVALVCFAFLFHLRSSLVAIVSLPLGILAAFIVMYHQGINANIMSLGGIAIAIGAMVDAAIVMIENVHKHLERWHDENSAGADQCGAVVVDRRSERSGRTGVVLQPADYHVVVRADLHAAGAGGSAVRAVGLYEDVRDGCVRGPRRHACAGADGLPDSRPSTSRRAQSAEPRTHPTSIGRLWTRCCCDLALRSSWRWCCSRSRRFHCCDSVASSCLHWTRGTCCICRPRCPDFQRVRRPNCCSRWTGC